ncbi:MAG TPA: hypothetical protein H9830_12460 [Candidatus Agrococcus pullicola]|uniref:Uncharacterized protein n=1 Tax=Candidatus Agrococcus pullicola TaxID=2838429 RepID=A0A9D1YWK3_9MICO|nr:hypothetical protein [Candidatus Agrococcus pullicola]
MNNKRTLHWPLIVGLAILALVRPLTRIVTEQAGIELGPAVPIFLTVLVSAAWISIVGFSRNESPLLTLLLAGIAYAIFAIGLSGILSPVLNGELQGPLANPIAIAPMLLLNAAWGLAAGALAMLIQHLRRTQRRQQQGATLSST